MRTFDRSWDRGFALEPDAIAAALTDEVRVVMLTNLHNPSGVQTSEGVLREVGALARSVGAKIIVDEVYLDAVPGPYVPAATLDEVFVSTNSLTKSYGLSGLRVGWILADSETVERANRVRDVVDAVGSFPSDVLGVLAVQRLDDLIARARGILGPGMDLVRDFVASRPELTWVEPPGGAVAFPRLSGGDDADAFVEHAARSFDVGVTPGRLFGEPAHFRVAVAGERAVLEEGLHALSEALNQWSPPTLPAP